ncbi:MAG: hypothetical protein AAFU67_17060 [Bacteroidota bacterium]
MHEKFVIVMGTPYFYNRKAKEINNLLTLSFRDPSPDTQEGNTKL